MIKNQSKTISEIINNIKYDIVYYPSGYIMYYKNDIIHRTDGPAVDHFVYKEWWVDSKRINCQSNEEFLKMMKYRWML
jgi:hypothetical protein